MTTEARTVGILIAVLFVLVLFGLAALLGAPFGLIPAAAGWLLLIRLIRVQRRAVKHVHDDGTESWSW